MLKVIAKGGRWLRSGGAGALSLVVLCACGGSDDDTVLLDADAPAIEGGDISADGQAVPQVLDSADALADVGEAELDGSDEVVSKANVVFLNPTVDGRKINTYGFSDVAYCNARGFPASLWPHRTAWISGAILTAEWSGAAGRWIVRNDLTPPISDQRIYTGIRCTP